MAGPTAQANQLAGREFLWLRFLITLAILVNLTGLFIPLMDPDAGVYASITRTMVESGNWLELYHKGTDWLDKPHLQFWITAVFFKIFGAHTWSYKLPALLFSFLAAWYTYRFAFKYFGRRVGLWAAVILLTAEHFIISNNDVRAEPFLTAFIIAAVYHYSNCFGKWKWNDLILGSVFAACAVMTKGPFTLMPVVVAIGGHLLIRKEWRELLHWKWLVGVALLILCITPELYATWYQFDRHPEKTVFGRTGVSGIRFFLWESQVGRFTNTGPIRGISEPGFFLHTLLWAFLPWSLLMYASLFDRLRTMRRQAELMTVVGSLVTVIVFSFSRFQLPYYTNIIFPFLAVMTSSWIFASRSRAIHVVQYALCILLVLVAIIFHFYYQPRTVHWPGMAVALLTVAAAILFSVFIRTERMIRALVASALVGLGLNVYLNTVLYPDLMQYHSGRQAALYINKNHPGQRVACWDRYSASLDFYLPRGLTKASPDSLSNSSQNLVWFVSDRELEQLRKKNQSFEILKEFPEFRISMLSLRFLNNKTRAAQLQHTYLVRFSNNP